LDLDRRGSVWLLAKETYRYGRKDLCCCLWSAIILL